MRYAKYILLGYAMTVLIVAFGNVHLFFQMRRVARARGEPTVKFSRTVNGEEVPMDLKTKFLIVAGMFLGPLIWPISFYFTLRGMRRGELKLTLPDAEEMASIEREVEDVERYTELRVEAAEALASGDEGRSNACVAEMNRIVLRSAPAVRERLDAIDAGR